jgi:hypothetical protein
MVHDLELKPRQQDPEPLSGGKIRVGEVTLLAGNGVTLGGIGVVQKTLPASTGGCITPAFSEI